MSHETDDIFAYKSRHLVEDIHHLGRISATAVTRLMDLRIDLVMDSIDGIASLGVDKCEPFFAGILELPLHRKRGRQPVSLVHRAVHYKSVHLWPEHKCFEYCCHHKLKNVVVISGVLAVLFLYKCHGRRQVDRVRYIRFIVASFRINDGHDKMQGIKITQKFSVKMISYSFHVVSP